ncbi:hypothetical protein [Pseudomarimonas arenosa]|uniref:Uncharacterized protein n=1 Tax=Pseudomarimonas arenosa TaxID=2774145 RepID=A0AAW3ZIZ5_9GAMM|nr:hypothetical protein [Pseudomarimonas arenosa]MBD8524662.1 hypothetical protein [Pseudomarimonas arenosa]
MRALILLLGLIIAPTALGDQTADVKAIRLKLHTALSLSTQQRHAELFEALALPSEVKRLREEGSYEQKLKKFAEKKQPALQWLLRLMLDSRVRIEFADDGQTAAFFLSESGGRLATMLREEGGWYLRN